MENLKDNIVSWFVKIIFLWPEIGTVICAVLAVWNYVSGNLTTAIILGIVAVIGIIFISRK